jgi:hypothetical protein
MSLRGQNKIADILARVGGPLGQVLIHMLPSDEVDGMSAGRGVRLTRNTARPDLACPWRDT